MATRREKGNSTWAVVLGIIGGILGVAGGFLAMLFGGVGMLFDPGDGAMVIVMGLIAVALGVLGFIGAGVAGSRPGPATAMLAIAGVGGFFTVLLFWIVPGALLLVAAVLAWQSRPSEGQGRPLRRVHA